MKIEIDGLAQLDDTNARLERLEKLIADLPKAIAAELRRTGNPSVDLSSALRSGVFGG